VSTAEEKLARFERARRILADTGPAFAVWFLAGRSPCCLHAGLVSPEIFEDDEELELVTEFLAETAPLFDGYEHASMELLKRPWLRAVT
jgi:hypothetical protein